MSPSRAGVAVPFAKAYDSGVDFVVVHAFQRPLRWEEVARAVCSRGHGIGAAGLLVVTGHWREEFRLLAYDRRGARTRPGDAAVRCAARAIRADYGLRRVQIAASRYRHEVQFTGDRVELFVPQQDIPAGPFPVRAGAVGADLSFYGLRAGGEHVVALLDGRRPAAAVARDLVQGDLDRYRLARSRFSLAEVLGADTVRVHTFQAGARVRPGGEDAVAAVAVASYLGHTPRPVVRVPISDAVSLRVAERSAGRRGVSGPGAIGFTGEFSWPYPIPR